MTLLRSEATEGVSGDSSPVRTKWTYLNAKQPAHSGRLFALRYPDSNQNRQDQNLQCYHYTIPQFRGAKIVNYLLLLK